MAKDHETSETGPLPRPGDEKERDEVGKNHTLARESME